MKDRIMRFNFRIALQVLIAFTLLAGYMFAFIPQPVCCQTESSNKLNEDNTGYA